MPETPALAAAAGRGRRRHRRARLPVLRPARRRAGDPRAAEKALARGMRTAALPRLPRTTTRALVGDTPLIPMTYASLLEAYGWERFETDARAAGATSFDRRRPAARLPAGAAADPARRAHLDRRAHRARGGRDRRLALPRHAHRDDRRTHRAVRRARRARSASASAHRTSRSTPGSGSRRPSTHARPPTLGDGIVVGSRAVQVAEEGPAALRAYVASLRAALDA